MKGFASSAIVFAVAMSVACGSVASQSSGGSTALGTSILTEQGPHTVGGDSVFAATSVQDLQALMWASGISPTVDECRTLQDPVACWARLTSPAESVLVAVRIASRCPADRTISADSPDGVTLRLRLAYGPAHCQLGATYNAPGLGIVVVHTVPVSVRQVAIYVSAPDTAATPVRRVPIDLAVREPVVRDVGVEVAAGQWALHRFSEVELARVRPELTGATLGYAFSNWSVVPMDCRGEVLRPDPTVRQLPLPGGVPAAFGLLVWIEGRNGPREFHVAPGIAGVMVCGAPPALP